MRIYIVHQLDDASINTLTQRLKPSLREAIAKEFTVLRKDILMSLKKQEEALNVALDSLKTDLTGKLDELKAMLEDRDIDLTDEIAKVDEMRASVAPSTPSSDEPEVDV